MNLYFGNWCFRPRLITSLLTLVLLGLFIFLGCWQLDRAEEKRDLYAEFETRQSGDLINLNQIDNDSLGFDNLLWRPIKASGHFLESYQVLLDNQVENTKAGYYIYTPLSLDDSSNIVLVNRGWLAAEGDRKTIPKLIMSEGSVNIKAVVKDIPKTGLLLKEQPPELMSEGVYRVQRIDLDELADLTNTNLLPYIVRLSSDSKHGYHRQWRLPGSGESVHNGYAFQWFAFATALFIIYLLVNTKRKNESGKDV